MGDLDAIVSNVGRVHDKTINDCIFAGGAGYGKDSISSRKGPEYDGVSWIRSENKWIGPRVAPRQASDIIIRIDPFVIDARLDDDCFVSTFSISLADAGQRGGDR